MSRVKDTRKGREGVERDEVRRLTAQVVKGKNGIFLDS